MSGSECNRKSTWAERKCIVSEEIKKGVREVLQWAEVGLTRSLLKRRYQKEGQGQPDEGHMEEVSRDIARQAHDTLVRAGKATWEDLKRVYKTAGGQGEGPR